MPHRVALLSSIIPLCHTVQVLVPFGHRLARPTEYRVILYRECLPAVFADKLLTAVFLSDVAL